MHLFKSLSCLAVVSLALFSVLPAHAAEAESESDSHAHCVRLSIGIGPAADGWNGPTGALAVDAGYAYCTPYFGAGASLRVGLVHSATLVMPAIGARIHTKSPAATGLEVGLEAQGGPALVSDFHADWGIGARVGADVRGWIHPQFGIRFAMDATFIDLDRDLIVVDVLSIGVLARF